MEAAYAMPDEGDQAAELAFAERLNLVLQDIPSEFQQEDFNALKEILDLLEDEDAYGRGMSHGRMQVAGTPIGEAPFEDDSESFHSGEQGKVSASDSIEVRLQKTMKHIDADWEMVIDNYFHGFNYCIKSFTSVIKPKFDESLDEMHRLKLKLDKAKLYAGSRTTDLREKHLKRTQHIEMLRILDIVDELNGVLPELDGMLRRRTFREYVDRLNWAVNAIMQEDMAGIGAVHDLRLQLLERKTAIDQIILDHLQVFIFLRQPQRDRDTGAHGSVYNRILASRHDALPRLPVRDIQTLAETARRAVASASAVDSAYQSGIGVLDSGVGSDSDALFLDDLLKSLLALNRIPAAHERMHKAMKAELKRFVDEAAVLVEQQIRGSHGNRSKGASLHSLARRDVLSTLEDALKAPPSHHLCAFLELVFQMLHSVLYRYVAFTRLCDLATGCAPGTNERRVQALAESWRDMQDTVEQLVLKHLQEPESEGEVSHTTAQLFQGTFETKLSYSFNSSANSDIGKNSSRVRSGGSSDGSAMQHVYAGSDFIRCSPYHITAICPQLLAFAQIGADLLGAAGIVPKVVQDATVLPAFVDDFVGKTFHSSLIADSNRLCSLALQGPNSFDPPRAPSRIWQPNRQPLKGCKTIVGLLQRLYRCATAMPTHKDKFLSQATALLMRFVFESRRQINMGGRSRVAYDIVIPDSRSASEGAVATAAALVKMLQGASNHAWQGVLRSRRVNISNLMRASKDLDMIETTLMDIENVLISEDPTVLLFTDRDTEALLKSEFGLLSAALHDFEQAESLVKDQQNNVTARPIGQFNSHACTQPTVREANAAEMQCTLLANVADSLAFLCECVESFELTLHGRKTYLQSHKMASDNRDGTLNTAAVPNYSPIRGKAKTSPASVAEASDISGNSSAGTKSSRTIFSALRRKETSASAAQTTSGADDDDYSTVESDIDDEEEDEWDDVKTLKVKISDLPLRSAINTCWALHDRCLLLLRIEMRVQCYVYLRRSRQAAYNIATSPINPEEFIVNWNRTVQRLNAVLKCFLPPEKHVFVMTGLPCTMAHVLEHESGIDEGAGVTAAGVMQMRQNVFALQKTVKAMHTGIPTLQAEDKFLDDFMRRLISLYDVLVAAEITSNANTRESSGQITSNTKSLDL